MKEVFLSRPNWIPNSHEKGIDNFYNVLDSMELNPRTIGKTDFPNQSPLDEVISLMKKCEGTIVLGLPQIEFESGIIKGKTSSEKIYLATEWNHIEAALAYSIGHPLLIIHHNQISRGIFDRGACNSFIYEVDMNTSDWSMSNEIIGSLKNWKTKLNKVNQERVLQKSNKLNYSIQWGMLKFPGEEGLYCPACFSKDGLKILCSRVNSRIYRCPNCKAELS